MQDTMFPSFESGENSLPDPYTVWFVMTIQDLVRVVKGTAILVENQNYWPLFDKLQEIEGYSQYNPDLGKPGFRVYRLKPSSRPLTFAISATCTGCGGLRDSWMSTCKSA
jgi:hypothetical protein